MNQIAEYQYILNTFCVADSRLCEVHTNLGSGDLKTSGTVFNWCSDRYGRALIVSLSANRKNQCLHTRGLSDRFHVTHHKPRPQIGRVMLVHQCPTIRWLYFVNQFQEFGFTTVDLEIDELELLTKVILYFQCPSECSKWMGLSSGLYYWMCFTFAQCIFRTSMAGSPPSDLIKPISQLIFGVDIKRMITRLLILWSTKPYFHTASEDI